MRDTSKRVANILKQEHPYTFSGTPRQIAERCLLDVFWRSGYELPENFYIDDEVLSIENVEHIYDRGYAAVINDGKLIAFKKENVL